MEFRQLLPSAKGGIVVERPGSAQTPTRSLTSCSRLTSKTENTSRFNHDSNQTPLIHRSMVNMHLSEQGLATLRQRSSLERRQVRNKSYYKEILYQKGYEINTEIKNLLKDIEFAKADQYTYPFYRKTAETKTKELQKLQAMLSDYNLVDDLINTGRDAGDVERQCMAIKADNEKASSEADMLFEMRKEKEALAFELETEVSQDNYVSDILSSTASPDYLQNYENLHQTDKNIKCKLGKMNSELKQLMSERKKLEAECDSLGRKQNWETFFRLREIESKEDVLFKDQCTNSDDYKSLEQSKEEYSDLLQCILKQMRDVKLQIAQTEGELKKAQEKIFDFQTDRNKKYDKLKKREEFIDSFLSSHNTKQSSLLEECRQYQKTIKVLLQNISKNFNSDSLESKTKISPENMGKPKLLLDLMETEKLEHQRREELKRLKQEIISFREKLANVSEMEDLKLKAKQRECELMNEKKEVLMQRNAIKIIIKDLKRRHDVLINKLKESDICKEISHLEKKWHGLEQKNFALREFLFDRKHCNNYSKTKIAVMETVQYLNVKNTDLCYTTS